MRLTLLFLIIFYHAGQCQPASPHLVKGKNLDSLKLDSSIKKIAEINKVTILFRRHSAWTFNTEYRIIAYSDKNHWTSYWYLDHEPINGLSDYPLAQDSVEKIWQMCIKNELFSLTDERNDQTNCNQMIFDTHHYEFIIIEGNKYKQISYYAPEFYLENCPKRPQTNERKKIIKCADAFISPFKMN